jgi:hypothetical protein
MKTKTLKNAIHISLFCSMLIATVIITKSTVKNIKQLYGSEKANYTAMSCFTDLIN